MQLFAFGFFAFCFLLSISTLRNIIQTFLLHSNPIMIKIKVDSTVYLHKFVHVFTKYNTRPSEPTSAAKNFGNCRDVTINLL